MSAYSTLSKHSSPNLDKASIALVSRSFRKNVFVSPRVVGYFSALLWKRVVLLILLGVRLALLNAAIRFPNRRLKNHGGRQARNSGICWE